MNYREKGKLFCNEINHILDVNKMKVAFVTGGGYAYDSIKYQNADNKGDFDFMIVYDNQSDIPKILELLEKSHFSFETKYLPLDCDLLRKKKIDIIRLSGNYLDTKSTINLVPRVLIEKICNFKEKVIIKKIAHNRNTSLFFAYGSDNSRIIINFIAPSFVTDNEDHYVHLDFSFVEKNNNIYLGILADAILKGFRENYDTINFKLLREKFIKNIHNYFYQNNIDSTCYINLFANNQYFPNYLKEKLLEEFNLFGQIRGKIEKSKKLNPIILTTDFNIDYPRKAFNFINNKPYKMTFTSYIEKMQNNEYNRQYLLDALGKFLGYLLSSNLQKNAYRGTIIDKILVYGVNDLYLPDYERYSLDSIIQAIINDLKNNSELLNNELIRNYLMICVNFLSKIMNERVDNILKKEKLSKEIYNQELSQEINIDTLSQLNSFNEVGTYHNYSSKVMPSYTDREAKFIESICPSKKARILDIMCGYGRLSNALVHDGYEDITGIDSEGYRFLGVIKDFKFIQADFKTYDFQKKYDLAYSLYNCYANLDDLDNIISKSHTLLDDNGILIIDYFNKIWRDSINPYFYKVLYDDGKYQLIIRRTYNKQKGDEVTYYELYDNHCLIKAWDFKQRFFSWQDVMEIINPNEWNYSLSNSSDLTTRTNEQKNVMVMRKKR